MPNHEAGDEAEAKIIEKQPMISVDQSHFTSEDAGEDSSEPQSLWSKVCCCFNDTNDKPNVKDDGLDKANENVISEYPVKPNVVIPGGNQQEESREDAKSKSEKAVSTSMAASMAATMAATLAAATAATAVTKAVKAVKAVKAAAKVKSEKAEVISKSAAMAAATAVTKAAEEAESKGQVESDALNDSDSDSGTFKNLNDLANFSDSDSDSGTFKNLKDLATFSDSDVDSGASNNLENKKAQDSVTPPKHPLLASLEARRKAIEGESGSESESDMGFDYP